MAKTLTVLRRGMMTSLAGFGVLVSGHAWALASLPCGFYVGGDWGGTHQYGKSYPGVSSISDMSTGWSAEAGYKVNPFFAVEAGYNHYGPTTLHSTTATIGQDNHYSVDATTKFILPIKTSGFELFAKLGAARIASQVTEYTAGQNEGIYLNTGSNSHLGFFGGLGLSFNFSRYFLATVQYTNAYGSNNTGNQQLLSIGGIMQLDPLFTGKLT